MTRHNAGLKIPFFTILQDLGLVDSVTPWFSPPKPKLVYEANNAQTFWDVPLLAEHQQVRANRVNARIINHNSKQVITLEMFCPWVTNREKRREEKTTKYGPLRWELKQKNQGYEVKQYSVIMDYWGDGAETKKSNWRSWSEVRAREFIIICKRLYSQKH